MLRALIQGIHYLQFNDFTVNFKENIYYGKINLKLSIPGIFGSLSTSVGQTSFGHDKNNRCFKWYFIPWHFS